jgi:hypothetical protein
VWSTQAGSGLKQDVFAFDELSVYPNPARGAVTVSMRGNVTQLKVQLVDLSGQVLMKTEIENGTQIKLDAIKPGLYFLNLSSGNANYTRRLLVD